MARNDAGLTRTGPLDFAAQSSNFDRNGSGERLVSAHKQWEPKEIGPPCVWPTTSFAVHAELSNINAITNVRCYFVHVPFAGVVAVLDLTFVGTLEDCILLQKALWDPSVRKTVDGKRFELVAAESLTSDQWTKSFAPGCRPEDLILGNEKQQFLCLGDPAILLLPGVKTTQSVSPDDIDKSSLLKILMKDVDIDYDSDMSPVSFPHDINGPRGMLVAVWASNTVALGFENYGQLGERRLDEIVRANCQILAALSLAGRVASRAHEILRLVEIDIRRNSGATDERRLDKDASDSSLELLHFSQQLQMLRLELAFGANFLKGANVVWGGRPLESYWDAMRDETRFDASVGACERWPKTATPAGRKQPHVIVL